MDALMIQTPPQATVARLVLTWGRGRTGKSTLIRTIAERARTGGHVVTIADANRTNATLSHFFDDVIKPHFPDDQSVLDWLDDLVNLQAEEGATVLLDMGGGDQVFPSFARALKLPVLLEGSDIQPVALHCIGPDVDDLACLRVMEESGAYCPAATALVLNEGLVRADRPREAAFAAVRAHPVYQAALARGAREVWFPRLGCMAEVTAGKMQFAAAEKKLGLTNRQRIAIWRRDVEAAFAPIADWLP